MKPSRPGLAAVVMTLLLFGSTPAGAQPSQEIPATAPPPGGAGPTPTPAADLIPASPTPSASPTPEVSEETEIPSASVPGQVLRVGVAVNPPYAQRTATGKWEGIAIDLWDLLAERLHLEYELVDTPREVLLDQIASGQLDLAVGEVPITAERMRQVDFTHPYFTSHLSLAFEEGTWKPDWAMLARDIFNRSLFLVIGAVVILLIFVSFLFWFFERQRNPLYRRKGLRRGLVSGIWYATATLTTVGTGSDEPRTISGTILGLFWMIMSVVLVGAVSASVASSVASASLRDARTVSDELERSVNGVVTGSLAEAVVERRHYYYRSFESLESAMQALSRRRVDTVVAGWVSLTYLNEIEYDGRFSVVRTELANYEYGIPLRKGSPLRDPLNIAILEIVRSPEWRTNLIAWLGRQNTSPIP